MADDEDEDNKDAQVDASLEDGENAEEDNEKASGGFNVKKAILLIVVPLLLIGGGAGAYFTGMLDSLLGNEAAEGEHGDEHASAEDHGGGGDDHGGGHDDGHGGGGPVFVEIPPQVVNLSSGEDDVPRVLRLRVELQVQNGSDKAAVEAVMPRVIDKFQVYLRELRVQDLKGSMGPRRLTAELLNRVNTAASPVEVESVLIQEMLIQ